MSYEPIEVVKHGPLYRATCWVRVRPGSPHRAMFVTGEARVTKWGTSAERAAERCRAKANNVRESDERIWRDRQERTTRFPS
jgi:hypothetical protein